MSSKLGSKVWMHQRFAHPPMLFLVVDLEGRWQHFFVGVPHPLLYGMYESAYSL